MMIRTFSGDEQKVKEAFGAAQSLAGELEDIFTDYDEESETCSLTATARGADGVRVSKPLWTLLNESDHWYRLSGGAFDSSLGSVTRAWRSSKRTRKTLTTEALSEKLRHTGWQHVQLVPQTQSVKFDIDELHLDFGAIAKGFIVDRVFEELHRRGLRQSLVNASGNMRCGDAPPNRQGWQIELAQFEANARPIRIVELVNQSVATSGDLWQYQMVDGIRRSHILDPKTGLGLTGSISVSVIAPTATAADACATAVCVLGPSDGITLTESLPNCAALILHRAEKEAPVSYRPTSGFPKPCISRLNP